MYMASCLQQIGVGCGAGVGVGFGYPVTAKGSSFDSVSRSPLGQFLSQVSWIHSGVSLFVPVPLCIRTLVQRSSLTLSPACANRFQGATRSSTC